jgi:hypothetical protein
LTAPLVRREQRVPIRSPNGKLHAMATNSGDTFSMCTGPVADGMEGVFFLAD